MAATRSILTSPSPRPHGARTHPAVGGSQVTGEGSSGMGGTRQSSFCHTHRMPSAREFSADEPASRWVMNKMWRFHRSVALHRFDADESGHWGYIRCGADVTTFDGSMSRFGFESLVYFPIGGWWSALFLVGAPVDLHVDIATPASVVDGIVTTIDLDLDVVVRGGKAVLLDAAEFEEHRVLHAYPDSHVRAAEQAAQLVHTLIAAGSFPFDGSQTARMSRMRAQTTE